MSAYVQSLENLLHLLRHSPESPDTDVALAEVAAQIGMRNYPERHRAAVGVVTTYTPDREFELLAAAQPLLRGYGIELTTRRHDSGTIYLYGQVAA